MCLGSQFQICRGPAGRRRGRSAPKMAPWFLPAEPYTCGACGIQFQFYNNLLEHMQSHAGKGPAAPRLREARGHGPCPQGGPLSPL